LNWLFCEFFFLFLTHKLNWSMYLQATANLVPLNTRRVAVKFDFFRIAGLVCILAPGILLQWVCPYQSSCHVMQGHTQNVLSTLLFRFWQGLSLAMYLAQFKFINLYECFPWSWLIMLRPCRYLLNHLEVAVVNWKSPTWMRSCGKWRKSFSSSSMIM
jgi:hypothetical protein